MLGQHIRLRWWQRGGRNRPRAREAWQEAFEVELPNHEYSEARLHKDTGTIIMRKSGGGGTVLDSKHMTVYKDGVEICGNCLHAIDSNGMCPNRECPCR